MRIYINGRFLSQSITGVQRYAIELVRSVDGLVEKGSIDSGIQWHLLLPPNAKPMEGLRHVRQRHVGRLNGHLWEQLELPFYCGDGLLFCPGNLAPLVSLGLNRSVVVTVHDLSFRYFPSAYSLAFRAWYHLLIPVIMHRARKVITVSKSERDSIAGLYPQARSRLFAIQNGASFAQGDVPPQAPEGARLPDDYLLYVGSLSRRKNFHGFVAAAQSMLAKERNLHAVVVGGTSSVFAGCGIELEPELRDRFHFLGQVNETAKMSALYGAARCLVFPSYYEASPLPPLEAMASGCPVIAASIPSLLERCGDAAVFCDPDSMEDIVQKIGRVLAWTPEEKRIFTEKARVHAAAFSWEKCAHETLKVLRTAI